MIMVLVVVVWFVLVVDDLGLLRMQYIHEYLNRHQVPESPLPSRYNTGLEKYVCEHNK